MSVKENMLLLHSYLALCQQCSFSQFSMHRNRNKHLRYNKRHKFSSDRSHNCIFIHNTDHNIISTQYTVLSVFFRTAISPRGNDWLLVAKILQSSGEYSYPGFWWRMHQQWHVLMRQTSKIQVWHTLPLLSVTSFPLMSNAPPWSRRFCWYLSSHLL